jgi:hypothetical protein
MKIIEYIGNFNEKDVYILKRIRGYKSNYYYVRFKCYKKHVLYLTNIENNSIIYQIQPIYKSAYLYDNIIYLCPLNSSYIRYKICLSNGYLIKEKSKYRQIIAQMNINLPKELIEYIKEYLY